MKPFTIPRVIAGLMLLWAIADNPYAYYQILRWVVCGVSGYGAFMAMEAERKSWAWAFGIVAVLFNPIAPIHFDRETWAPIDFGVSMLMFASLYFFKVKTENTLITS